MHKTNQKPRQLPSDGTLFMYIRVNKMALERTTLKNQPIAKGVV